MLPHETVYARVGLSKIHGVGVIAIKNIPKGTKVFPEDDSELFWFTKNELKLEELPPELRLLYNQFCLIKDKGETYGCPKSFNLMTVPWYLNHSLDPNLGCDQDFTFFALRNVVSGEELTANYYSYNDFARLDWI